MKKKGERKLGSTEVRGKRGKIFLERKRIKKNESSPRVEDNGEVKGNLEE